MSPECLGRFAVMVPNRAEHPVAYRVGWQPRRLDFLRRLEQQLGLMRQAPIAHHVRHPAHEFLDWPRHADRRRELAHGGLKVSCGGSHRRQFVRHIAKRTASSMTRRWIAWIGSRADRQRDRRAALQTWNLALGRSPGSSTTV